MIFRTCFCIVFTALLSTVQAKEGASEGGVPSGVVSPIPMPIPPNEVKLCTFGIFCPEGYQCFSNPFTGKRECIPELGPDSLPPSDIIPGLLPPNVQPKAVCPPGYERYSTPDYTGCIKKGTVGAANPIPDDKPVTPHCLPGYVRYSTPDYTGCIKKGTVGAENPIPEQKPAGERRRLQRFECMSDLDCPSTKHCYRAGTPEALCIDKGMLGATKSEKACLAGYERYTTPDYTGCIKKGTVGAENPRPKPTRVTTPPRSLLPKSPCKSDHDCPTDRQCYRAGTKEASCINRGTKGSSARKKRGGANIVNKSPCTAGENDTCPAGTSCYQTPQFSFCMDNGLVGKPRRGGAVKKTDKKKSPFECEKDTCPTGKYCYSTPNSSTCIDNGLDGATGPTKRRRLAKRCNSDSMCAAGMICTKHRCVVEPPFVSLRRLGGPICFHDSDCQTALSPHLKCCVNGGKVRCKDHC